MVQHPPAARRAILRDLKHGEHPTKLITPAKAIQDPGHAAATLLALADDDRLPSKKAAQLVRDATALIGQIERPGRYAEALSDCLEELDYLERGPETDAAADQFAVRCVQLIDRMPDGEWTTDAIVSVAPHLPNNLLPALMRRALRNQGGEAQGAKALLDREPELASIVKAEASPEVAALALSRLGATDQDALSAAWKVEDPVKRREALRVLIWKVQKAEDLPVYTKSCKGRDDVDRAAVLTMIAGRADRLGADTNDHFGAAMAAVAALKGNDAVKAQRKLAQTMERAGLEPVPITAQAVEPEPEQDEDKGRTHNIPVKAAKNHVLALVDGYAGGLGAPHLRAIARAAPLCMAFDLDLALIGFPSDDEKQIVSLVEAETNVGEDAGYAQKLYDDGRLFCIPMKSGVPAAWPGTPIATTPHPQDGKSVALEDVPGPICLLLGLGKQGLPKRTLNVVEHHHELTGQGISMETATAMGILADRLGRIPK